MDRTIELINNRPLKYTELGLGSIEGYKEYVLKKLIEDFRGVLKWKNIIVINVGEK